jgi:hypothetical protein
MGAPQVSIAKKVSLQMEAVRRSLIRESGKTTMLKKAEHEGFNRYGIKEDVGVTVEEVNGHTHDAQLENDKLASSEPVVVQLQAGGDDGHTHEVTVTPEQLKSIGEGQTVDTESTPGGADSHVHHVTFAGQAAGGEEGDYDLGDLDNVDNQGDMDVPSDGNG